MGGYSDIMGMDAKKIQWMYQRLRKQKEDEKKVNTQQPEIAKSLDRSTGHLHLSKVYQG